MADPVRKTPSQWDAEPHSELQADDFDVRALAGSRLERWVEQPDGSMRFQDLPLTPALFMDPQLEDKMTQGELHADLMAGLKELLSRHFEPRPDVKVLMDMKHLLGPGLPAPSPDISIVQGVRHPGRRRQSFSLAQEGVTPSLIVEIISPLDPRIRRMDEVDKVTLYQKVGIPEYILVDTPRQVEGGRLGLKGYRLGLDRRYRPMEPDAQERLRSHSTGLLFGISRDGNLIEVFDSRTGDPLRTPREIEAMAARESVARKAAEEELERLRAEVERMKRLNEHSG